MSKCARCGHGGDVRQPPWSRHGYCPDCAERNHVEDSTTVSLHIGERHADRVAGALFALVHTAADSLTSVGRDADPIWARLHVAWISTTVSVALLAKMAEDSGEALLLRCSWAKARLVLEWARQSAIDDIDQALRQRDREAAGAAFDAAGYFAELLDGLDSHVAGAAARSPLRTAHAEER